MPHLIFPHKWFQWRAWGLEFYLHPLACKGTEMDGLQTIKNKLSSAAHLSFTRIIKSSSGWWGKVKGAQHGESVGGCEKQKGWSGETGATERRTEWKGKWEAQRNRIEGLRENVELLSRAEDDRDATGDEMHRQWRLFQNGVALQSGAIVVFVTNLDVKHQPAGSSSPLWMCASLRQSALHPLEL